MFDLRNYAIMDTVSLLFVVRTEKARHLFLVGSIQVRSHVEVVLKHSW